MKITDHILKANGKTLFSFEIIPPKKGTNIQELYNNIDPLMEFKPPFIDVTTSREEFIYIKRGDLLEKRVTRMRPGTLGICASIKYKYAVDTVPHILCGGFTPEETEYMLVDCHYLGINNVLSLRGDAMKGEPSFIPSKEGRRYALDLVKQIKNLNKGKYLNDFIETEQHTDFCIGVAGYPEKHMEAPSMESDLKYLQQKVENGADYIITQMFFDTNKYRAFLEKVRALGITVPIIPGIKPISTKSHLNILPKIFKIDIPNELVRAVETCRDNEQVRQVGIEWAIQQSKELLKIGVPVLHYYSMGKSDNIKEIAREVF